MPAPEDPAAAGEQHAQPGRVYLVGAGPGDGGLLSARALALIAAADTILHDRLIPDSALDGARADAELLFVGKEGGGESVPQEQTEELMVARARAGRTVVRLKGGDPFVFGRGGEEALRLRAAGIPYEIVPGITAGIAAAAQAGIPVTQRGVASAVALITGHEDPDKGESAIDWDALAAFPGTLVFYMGVRQLGAIADALIAGGRPAGEPAAVIERGTLPDQRSIVGTLSDIAERASAAGVRAPSITVVGPVVALTEQLAWFQAGPLSGLTIAVTRARAQASALAERLQALGARVIQAPAIRTRAITGPPLDPAPYDLLCVTSAEGAAALFDRLRAGGRDARALAGKRVAAIGAGTAAALAERGVIADVVPERAVAEGLAEEIGRLAPAPRRALIARAREGREVLPEALRALGAEVEVLALYETIAESPPARVVREAAAADYVTFTSASTVRFFLDALAQAGTELEPTAKLVSIGPITSQALRERGLEPTLEAAVHDIDGLMAALLADAAARSG